MLLYRSPSIALYLLLKSIEVRNTPSTVLNYPVVGLYRCRWTRSGLIFTDSHHSIDTRIYQYGNSWFAHICHHWRLNLIAELFGSLFLAYFATALDQDWLHITIYDATMYLIMRFISCADPIMRFISHMLCVCVCVCVCVDLVFYFFPMYSLGTFVLCPRACWRRITMVMHFSTPWSRPSYSIWCVHACGTALL